MSIADDSPPSLPVVVRAVGVTDAEQYLQRLCDRTFLSLWSYPSVFRDQRTGGRGDGKEICDLLVVFGDEIIIFSDKSCAFPSNEDSRVSWCRWFKKAVMESAKQAWGAERWLREHPDRVFIDRSCTQAFPLAIPASDKMRVHHVIVAHNIAEHCVHAFGGGSSGTLMLNTSIVGADHFISESCASFQIGWLDPDRSYVHVLDDESLEILLRARDTITDLVEYLRAKEELFRSMRDRDGVIVCPGEEELLAIYLTTMTNGRHGFDFPEEYNGLMIPEGEWAAFENSLERRAQLEADEVSYAWDAVIEKFNKNILDGTSYRTSVPEIAHREKAIRFLAREPRVRRRMLAETVIEMLEKTGPRTRMTRVFSPSYPGDPYYCFLVLPHLPQMSDDDYRRIRSELLFSLCCVTKLVLPEAQDIVGFATETGIEQFPKSEDIVYLDARQWTEELEEQARESQAKHGFLTNLTRFEGKISEYPNTNVVWNGKPGPNPRNKLCPCGSGKKYKWCHGR